MDDFWNAAKGVLATVAPTLATAIGGPLAGTAVNGIISALGLAPDTDEKTVAATVQAATPEQLLALKKADQDFQATMAKLQIDADKLVYDDRASARTREVQLHDLTPTILATSVTAGFLGLMGLMSFVALPAQNETLLNILLGSLGTGWVMVLSYYFGGMVPSRGSTATKPTSTTKPSAS